jgi:carboxymethylenebutenolidase
MLASEVRDISDEYLGNWRTIRRNIAMTEFTKNLGAVFDTHVKAEFIDKDVAATMATMVAEPYLTHVPTLTGGTGRSEVERFYRYHFVGHWPHDVEVKPLSRTVGQNRVVDELIVSFTHDREMRAYLPGVPPTGRKVVLPHVVVMGFDEAGRIAYEHIFWDQASLLVQVGLLDPALLPPNRPNVCLTLRSLQTR